MTAKPAHLTIRFTSLIALCLLAACASSTALVDKDHDPADRYKILRKFIPEGTESVILGDINAAYSMLRNIMPGDMNPRGYLLFLYAGSDQEFPVRAGFGDARQIAVYDPGIRGLSASSYPKAGAEGIEEIALTQGPVLWRRKPPSPDNSPLSQPWMAIQANRYLLQSGSRDLLMSTIKQAERGKPYEPIHIPKDFDGNAPVIVMRRLDSGAEPGQTRAKGRRAPDIEAYCFTGKATEIGFEGLMWIQAQKPDLLRPYIQRYGLELGGQFQKVDDRWWKIPARVRLGAPPKRGVRILYLFHLAGCKIATVPAS